MGLIKIPLNIAKSSMAKGDKKFNSSHKSYGNFNIKADLSYISDGERFHKLDIYTPVEKKNNITILYIHGGAYVQGYKEDHYVFCSWFVNRGFSVVSMNYRLASREDNFTVFEQIRDIFSVLKFIEENDLIYGINKDNLVLLGDSSGGHLALMTDIIFHDQEAQDYYQIKELPKVKIHAVALNSPMYDYVKVVELGKKLLTKRNCIELFSKNYRDIEYLNHNSPRYYLQKNIKIEPIFANSSVKDFFNEQFLILKKDCLNLILNFEYIFETIPNKKVGHVYNHFMLDDGEGLKCNEAIVSFFLKNTKLTK